MGIDKLSWKIQSDEFYAFEKYLIDNNIEFHEENDTFVITHEGDVDLGHLLSLPDNVQFNNEGDVWLDSLKSLPENKYEIFKNNGIVRYYYYKGLFDPRIKEKLSWQEIAPGFVPTNKGMMEPKDIFSELEYSSYSANRDYDRYIEPYSDIPNPSYNFEESEKKWRNNWIRMGWSPEKVSRFERRYSIENNGK